MNLFGLIIQQTITGLSDQYVSNDLIALRSNKEILDSATDERMIATKLSNQSDVYAVQVTKNYRVYSLIVTNVSDFVGGAGFYAIRLYTPKKFPLDNFEMILDELKNQYLDYRSRDVTRDNQDYTQILSGIMSVENNKQEFVCLNGKGEGFLYFDPNNTKLGTSLNSRGVYLFNKVYAFNKEKAVHQPAVANSLGLVEFQENQTAQKEIVIHDKQQLLEELKINGQNASFEQNSTDFIILCRDNDFISYNTSDDNNFRTISGANQSIEKKYVPPPKQGRSREEHSKPEMYKPGVFIAVGLMVVLLVAGIWYLFFYGGESDDGPSTGNVISRTTGIRDTGITVNSQTISFVRETTESDTVYKTDYDKLDKYRFKFEKNQWYYKNIKGQNKYYKFGPKTINKISSLDNLTFSENKSKEFLSALHAVSKHEIKEDTIMKSVIVDEPKEKKSPEGLSHKKSNPKQEQRKNKVKSADEDIEQINNKYKEQ
jgi:hypothetical protein